MFKDDVPILPEEDDTERVLRRMIAERADWHQRAFLEETKLWREMLVEIEIRRPPMFFIRDGVVSFER